MSKDIISDENANRADVAMQFAEWERLSNLELKRYMDIPENTVRSFEKGTHFHIHYALFGGNPNDEYAFGNIVLYATDEDGHALKWELRIDPRWENENPHLWKNEEMLPFFRCGMWHPMCDATGYGHLQVLGYTPEELAEIDYLEVTQEDIELTRLVENVCAWAASLDLNAKIAKAKETGSTVYPF